MNHGQTQVKDELGGNESLGHAEDDVYRPRPQMPKPFVVMRSLQHLMNGLENGTIDIDPEYQREVVWTADRMTGLINSLMENFYIPPIILNKKPRSAENGGALSDTLTCVDGKQRLSSVRAFIKGMIPCHDHGGEKWWFCDDRSSSRRKRILSEQTQMQFLAKEFVSFEFTNLSPEQEEDLFARVQMGVQLSVAEKMRAQTGPWQELARLFVDDFPSIYSLMKERARAKDFQLTLSCFSQIVEVMHPTASNGIPILKTNHSHLPKLLSNKGAVDDGLKSHLANVWNTFKELISEDSNTFTNERKTLMGVQTFAPIEMVAVTVLISKYSETRNNQLLLGDIQVLRETLREQFTDLRLNVPTWKFVWDFIEDLEAIRGAVNRSTVNRKRPSIPTPRSFSVMPATARTLPAAPARGRRLVAKTILSTVQLNQGPVTIKRDKAPFTPQSSVRPAKRPRTSLKSLDGEALATAGASTETGLSSMSGKRPVGSSHAKRSFASMPTQAAPQAESMAFIAPPPSATASVTHSPNEQNIGYDANSSTSIPAAQRSSSEQKSIVMTPGEARRKRVSELNSYQAPSMPMQSPAPPARTAPMRSTPTAAKESTTSAFPMWPKPTPTAAMLLESQATTTPVSASSAVSNAQTSSSDSPMTQIALGAFAPNYVEAQWEGTIKSVSPEEPPQPSSSIQLVPVQRTQTTPRINTKSARPSLPQYDGVIDLTSDTEEERRNLLTAFKKRSNHGV